MRRVNSDGDSQGIRGLKAGVGRPGSPSSRAKLRRSSLESLERRELLSTLPTPALSSAGNLVSTFTPNTGSANSPSVAVDPINPQKLVAAWTVHDTTNPLSNQVTSYVQGAYSVDGGVTWNFLGGAGSANVQTNFSVSQMGGPFFFHVTGNASVGFDRAENAYLLTETATDDGTSGVIDLQRYDFSGGAPAKSLANKVVYSWDGADSGGPDSAQAPTLAVDNNLPAFVDTSSSGLLVAQNDPHAGNVYVAWAETDTNTGPTGIGNFNPQTIRVVASSDQGASFTHAAYVDDPSNSNNGGFHSSTARYVEPSIAISQGRAPGTLSATDRGVPGGQVTIVYDDYGTGAKASIPFDQIISQTNVVGGTSATVNGPNNTPIVGATPGANGAPDTPGVTNIPIAVSITDPNFTTLQALDVNLKIAWPDMTQLDAVLIPPPSLQNQGIRPIFLFTNGVDSAGTAVPGGLTGANLGATTGTGFGNGSGTVFDQESVRSIRDGNAKNPYVGHYAPVGNLSTLAGLTGAELSGTWTLQVVDFRANTTVAPKQVVGVALNFSAGNNPGFNPAAPAAPTPQVLVANFQTIIASTPAVSSLTSGASAGTPLYRQLTTGVSADPGRVTTSAAQPTPVLPSPAIAVDNTLGAYSQHTGRIYVAYTGRIDQYRAIAKDQTDIFMLASDDGGATWTALSDGVGAGIQVNHDEGALDGFSGASPGTLNGRPQFQPQVAVDQTTGTLVVSYLDARNDASRARVATYISTSSDGGRTFAPDTYANLRNTAVDAITGRTVVLGPIPDNQSAGSNQDPFGFGQHQALAVADGRIVPVWASNENLGSKTPLNNVRLSIASSVLTLPAGPRVVSATMGPVGQPGDTVNTIRGADGSPVANSFIVKFDRPIDPATFNPDGTSVSGQPIGTGDVRVFYQDPYGAVTQAVNTPLTGFFSSGPYTPQVAFSGHPGVPVVDGQVNVSLSGFADLGTVTIQLVSPAGKVLNIPTIPGTKALNTTVPLPTYMLGGAVDGTYTLRVSSNPGQIGTFQNFSVQLNGVSTGLRVLSTNPVQTLNDPQNNGSLGYTTFRVIFDTTNPVSGLPTGVGTYSYIVRPTLNDRIRNIPSATPTRVTNGLVVNGNPSPNIANATTSVTVSGHPGQFFDNSATAPAQVSATFTAANPIGTADVTLTTPDGRVIPIFSTTNAGTTLALTNVPLPIAAETFLLDGTYTLGLTTSAGTVALTGWALALNGSVFTPNFAPTTITENAVGNQVPLPILGTNPTGSFLYLVGHPAQRISGGTLRVSLTDTNVANLTLTLISPTGVTFVLPKSGGTALNQSYVLPAGFANQLVDGKWGLQIVGSNGADVGVLNGWSLQLVAIGPNGNAMDQNSDGIGGQDPETTPYTGLTPGDDFITPNPTPAVATTFSGPGLPSGPYSNDTLPLIAAGPHIIGTTVTGVGGATTGTTADNLVANDQVGSVGLVFDRNVQVATVNGGQVLGVVGPAGPITGPQTFNSTGIAKTFTSVDVGRLITQGAATPLVSVLQIAGTGLSLADLKVTVNVTDANNANLNLVLIAPDGTSVPLVAAGVAGGANFSNTTFSDTPGANGLTIPIASGTAPYGLTYQPSALLSALRGKVLDGIWRLQITDTSPAGTPQGRLNGWSLAITPLVPDGGILDSTLTIPSTGSTFTLANLAVRFNVNAPKLSDLSGFLIGPDGTTYSLFGFIGGFGTPGASSTTLTLDPNASVSIQQATLPFQFTTYAPFNQPGVAHLDSARGKALDGRWTLRIVDNAANGQALSATLTSWSLIATPQVKVTPLETYASTDAGTQTYVSTDASPQVYPSGAADAANPAGDATFNNPLPIGTALGSTATSQIVIPSTGGTFNIADLKVALNITYARDTNLSVQLIAPDGTTLPLFAGVGGLGANFGDNLGNYTIFGDFGTTGIAQGTAPFISGPLSTKPAASTIFRAASTFSGLIGKSLEGTWTLQVINNQTNGPAGGFLNNWALIATPRPAPASGSLPIGAAQPGEPIPVVDPSVASPPLISSITFAPSGSAFTIAALTANLTLTAGAGGDLSDLTAVLIAPDGTQATLFRAGDGTVGGTGTVKVPVTPFNPISGQSQFVNVAVDGTWQLELFDTNTARASNVLAAWSLAATPNARALKQAPEPIPNTPASSLTSTITIADNVPLNALKLQLNVGAPTTSNLTAVLIGPNGQRIRLFTKVGGAGVNFENTVFSDSATTSIDNAAAPFNGTFKPEDPLSGLYASNTTLGQWRLVLTDTVPNAGGPAAVLYDWSLVNTPPANTALANTFVVSFPTQQLSGTYAVTVGAGVLAAEPSFFNPMAPPPVAGAPPLGTPANPNLNAGVDVLKGISSTGVVATTQVVYNAAALPLAIPAGGVLSSQIIVPDNFLIQGVTAAGLPGLSVQLNITYPTDQDLAAVLIAPDGTRINLFTNVGVGSSNFNNTILADTVNPPAPIGNAGNGFFGAFNPETPLSNLKGHSSGVNGGVWTLQITNKGSAATGRLNSWKLAFEKPLPTSGLGDPVADRQTVDFRIFNLAPTNPLANDTWTAVGPAGVTVTPGQKGTFAGPVASIAYDPSDPTRNTVYVAASSGGIWKTSNFLTTDPAGPTYQPMTDFGPNFSLDVGSIAVYGRSSDPNQSILFAGTGFAQATYPYNGQGINYPNYGGNAGRGVGFLRSFDGGQNWGLLDSTINVYPGVYPATTYPNGTPVPAALAGKPVPAGLVGTELPIASPFRDHRFVGTTTYKVLADPTPLPNGNVIVYAALGGPNGGLYQSLDTGATWNLLQGGTATDIIFDPNSKSASTGNIDIVYAAFQGQGVFISTNRGLTLTLMKGQLGSDPLIQGPETFPASSATVGHAADTPNGARGRIVLSKPALTGNAAVDLLYQDWLYAAVENADGSFNGLYITKDRGQNWTLAKLLGIPDPLLSITPALPTNDNAITTSYDPTANQPTTAHAKQGNYSLTLTVDPSNPNIVYLGGSQDFQDTGLIRVDLTNMYDAHNLVSFANDRNDGGKLTLETAGAINVENPTTRFPTGVIYSPPLYPLFPATPYLNFRHAPNTPNIPGTSPFNVNATLVIYGRASQATVGATDFTNDGTGVKWTLLDEPLKANAGDLTSSTNLHYSTAFIDPLTGNVRLVFADDQGVFTALLNADGSLDFGIGTAGSANYSRNGNLQDQQLFYGAAQPSNVAAQAAGALFYASGQGVLAAQSAADILSTGNITWDNSGVLTPTTNGPRDTSGNALIVSSDRGGVGIATDPTGGAGGSGPAVYEYDVPSLGGNITDFFRVNGVGQTTGLDNNFVVDFPFGNFRANGTSGKDLAGAIANGQIPLGNFVVNPLNGSQIIIGSATGVLYQTTNRGIQWLPIGQATDFDGTQLSAMAYGAPDPNAPGGIGNLNNFIYVGSAGGVGGQGKIFVTRTGGQGWVNISSGLDGASVVGIYPSPDRGSHAAYAITLNGVFYSPDTLAVATNTSPVWTNITGNLTQIQRNPFNDALLGQSAVSTFSSNTGAGDQGTAAYGGFRSIVADYRYAVPDPFDATRTNPVLYVAGYGGVFRSLDNGQTWTVFPNTAFDSAPVDGGYLPSVEVTNLQLNLGSINPATGRPTQVLGDPEVLLATTYGRGAFAIRLAPNVFPTTIHLDTTLPAPGGSDTGFSNTDRITSVKRPYIDGISELSNFGNVVTITLIDQANGAIIGTGTTDAFGRFSIQVGTYLDPSMVFNDPSFLLDGVKNVGIQATDSSGAKGNVTTFTYTLKATLPNPPGAPVLEAGSDSGRFNNDRLTNVTNPIFDIATTEPATSTVQLYRFNGATGKFDILVGSALAGVSPVKIQDNNLAALAQNNPIFANFQYEAVQIDNAGNASGPSQVLTISVNTTLPPTLAPPSLDPASNSGLDKSKLITNVRNPVFNTTGVASTNQLFLLRSIGGAAPVLAGIGAVGANTVYDAVGVFVDGVYVYQVVQVDIWGNQSKFGRGTVVTISTQLPAPPSLILFPADDSGAPTHPDITNVRSPRFQGVGTPGLGIVIYATYSSNHAQDVAIASTTVAADGTYLAKASFPLDDNVYHLVARTINAAGNVNYSSPLTVTIKAIGPQIVPTLSILGVDDTGIKGDGVTANHRPRFVGRTDPGDIVNLYAVINGQLSGIQASATASTINGSFQFQLPFNLTNGSTQVVAQATDIAGNKGALSPVFNVRIITVAGDYVGAGSAQFAVFLPATETYVVNNFFNVQVDSTPGRDIPVQYDYNGDGITDLAAYRFNAAQYHGFVSNNSTIDFAFGNGNLSLPVSGYYDATGIFTYAVYNPDTALWAVNLPRPGGLRVNFGVPKVDVPVPAAYDGGGVTEIATFRPSTVFGNDADSFNVLGSNFAGNYQVSFSDPTIPALRAAGFAAMAGDLPAPADYDGIGKDEFAIYRPTTGQFFILKVANLFDKSTWTLRTVSLNIPGGPLVGDVPASQDYEGTGKASPTIYRTSNATFYELPTTGGALRSVHFTQAGVTAIAASGPLLYRLQALQGTFATTDGYPASSVVGKASVGSPGSGGKAFATSIDASATTGGTSATLASSSTIALAAPTAVVGTLPAASIPITPLGVGTVAVAPAGQPAPVAAAHSKVTVGAPIPKAGVKSHAAPKSPAHAALAKKAPAPARPARHAAAPAKPLTVHTTPQSPKFRPDAEQHRSAVAAALLTLGSLKKVRQDD